MKRNLYILFILSIFSFNAFAVEISVLNKINVLLAEIVNEPNDSIKIEKLLTIVDLCPDTAPQRLEFAQKALEIAEKIKWQAGIGTCNFYMGLYYFFNQKQDLAIQTFLSAAENTDDPAIMVDSYGLISNLYSWRKEHDMAIKYAVQGWHAIENSDLLVLKGNANVYMGDAYRYKGDRDKADAHYLEASRLFDQDTSNTYLLTRISYLHTLRKTTTDDIYFVLRYALGMKYVYAYASNLERQLFTISLMKIATAYSDSGKNELINELELENKQKQTRLYIIGIILLLLMATILIWQNYKRKQANDKLAKANEELEKANEMKALFFGILNHDLRKPVAGLINYLQLKKAAPEMINPEDAVKFEQKTMDMTQSLLENMEDLLFWCKDQMQSFTPEFVTVNVSDLFSSMQDFFRYEQECLIDFEMPVKKLEIKTDLNYLKTIMRNLTSNACKSVMNIKDGKIEWSAKQDQQTIVLMIRDNGSGITDEKMNILKGKTVHNAKDGLGLQIVRDLSKTIHCEIEVESLPGQGSTFFLIFKENMIEI